jgi:hypothetical protein
MCGDVILLVLLCMHIGEMMRNKGRPPFVYQLLAVLGWFGGEILGLVLGIVIGLAISNGNDDLVGTGAGIGFALGLFCGAGTAYLIAYSTSADPNYRPAPVVVAPYGPSPYGSPRGPLVQQNPFAEAQAPQQPFQPAAVTSQPASSPPAAGNPFASGQSAAIPQFLPASAFAPGPVMERRVQFSCPSGHLLEESSFAAGQQRRCPHCGGVAVVPTA